MIHALAIACMFLSSPSADDSFAPIRFLAGNWQGTGSGAGGPSAVVHSFEDALGGKFIRWDSRAVFPNENKSGAQTTREALGLFSYDPDHDRIALRRFLPDGTVHALVLTSAENVGDERRVALVFMSQHAEGDEGERARLTATATAAGKVRIVYEQAAPNGEFMVYRRQDLRKLDPENWMPGIDVSHFSGDVDWSQVRKADSRFAFLKATEGNDWVDPTFQKHMTAAKQAGLVRGAYHFFVAHDDPEPQAENFIKNVTLEPGDLPPVVDVETMSSRPVDDLPARLRTWLKMVEDHYGVKPIIYTSPRFWNNEVKADFSDHPLWVAEYRDDLPTVPQGWLGWVFWQNQGDQKTPGVGKTADLNYFNGGMADLKRLLMK